VFGLAGLFQQVASSHIDVALAVLNTIQTVALAWIAYQTQAHNRRVKPPGRMGSHKAKKGRKTRLK